MASPPFRAPVAPVDADALTEAIVQYVTDTGVKRSFNMGNYHHLTKDSAVSVPSLHEMHALVGAFLLMFNNPAFSQP